MAANKSLHWLDLRDTDIPHEIVEGVNKLLLRNRLGLDDVDDSYISDEEGETEDDDEETKSEVTSEKVQANESSDDD